MANFEDLPNEIIEFILTYLPPYRDLEECKVVSKRWNAIVKSLIHRSKLNISKGLKEFRLCWQSLKPCPKNINPMIAGRFSHSSVLYNNEMYVFGGGSSCETTYNDLWKFDLSKLEWMRPLSKGSYPSPKGSATMIFYKGNLVLFGGWRYPSLHPPHQQWCLFDELHLYDLKTNRWINQFAMNRPPAMAGHSVSVHGQKMVVFGGYQVNGDFNSNSNETWCLDLESFVWCKPRIANKTKPQPRYGQYQTELDEDNLLIFGGCGGPNSCYSDAWVLKMAKEPWEWVQVPVRNKKYSPTHLWWNPICKVGSKLIVFGSTPNMPTDLLMIKQNRSRQPSNSRRNSDANQNNNPNVNRPNANANQPPVAAENQINQNDEAQQRDPLLNEAANRLQKNLALKPRDYGSNLPRRFDEFHEDRFKMVAFSNQQNMARPLSRDHQERIRRLEEKMNTIRNTKRAEFENKVDEPSPKRNKRNVVSMFICDIHNAQCPVDPHLQWIEYKNYGVFPGAPERFILSSVVPGNGELILFGGVQKETLTEITHEVSNAIHFLTAPKDII